MLFLAVFVVWVLGPRSQREHALKNIRKQLTSPPTEAWFEFSEAGFMSTGQGGRSAFYPWTTVPKILQRPDGFLVYFDAHNYYWIPLHAFVSADDYRTAAELARSKVKLFQLATG